MKNYISIILIFLCSINFTFAQPNRENIVLEQMKKVEQIDFVDDFNNYGTKGLPIPPIIGANPSDKLAAELAKKISAYDEKSYPLLIATLQKAGFHIIAENQKVLYQPTFEKGMGLAFYDYELPGMYKTSQAGSSLTFAKFGEILQSKFPTLPKNRFAELMLDDLRTAANSKQIEVRFWARLIIELGKNFPTPVDLMMATPETATINTIQASLIERRLIGDVIALATKLSAQNEFGTKPNIAKIFRPDNKNVQFTNASFSENLIKEPCNYADVETLATDVQSTVSTTVHGKALELIMKGIGKSEEFINGVGTSLGSISAVLSWAKLAAAASQVNGTITVEQPLPLIRTKSDKVTGEKRLLTGKFEIKVNDLRNLNCMRSAINSLTGLDFSMPSSGPLAGKPISWDLGGDVSFKGQNSSKTGEFDQIVFLKSPDGGDYTKLVTNDAGESKIYIEGGKQKRDLTNLALVPLTKHAIVRADVAMKNMSDSKQEAADVGGFALGIAVGGVSPLGIISAIPEIFNRMKIPVKMVSVPIRDWQPCRDDWGGVITINRTLNKTEVVKGSRKSNGNSTGDGSRKISINEKYVVTLNPRTKEEFEAKQRSKKADIAVTIKNSNIFDGSTESNPCCDINAGDFTTIFRQGTESDAGTNISEYFDVEVRSTQNDWTLNLGGGFHIPYQANEFLEILKTNCQHERDQAYSRTANVNGYVSFNLPSGRYGGRLKNEAGEVLAGTKTQNLPDGSIVEWKWEVARCK
jgi:hypothetical protein